MLRGVHVNAGAPGLNIESARINSRAALNISSPELEEPGGERERGREKEREAG